MAMNDLQTILDLMDRELSRLLEKAAEINRDRAKILAQLEDTRRIAARYSDVSASAPIAQPVGEVRQTVKELVRKSDVDAFDGTVGNLVHRYLTDSRSPIHTLRHATRQHYGSLSKIIIETNGSDLIGELKEPQIEAMYAKWSHGGKRTPMGHAMITMFRTLAVFGAKVLGDERCERLCFVLHRMKFTPPEPSKEELTEEQALAIIEKANEIGLPSIGLAQAIQFYCPLRQKDVIGEWLPITEPGESDTTKKGKKKWLRGLRWENLDSRFVLTHVTSKEGKRVEMALEKYPVIMRQIAKVARQESGPMIVSEESGLPWLATDFRKQWRRIARLCKISDKVKNRDSVPVGVPSLKHRRPRRGAATTESREASPRLLN
jgi:hypothetical protein